MQTEKVEMYLITNAKFFPTAKMPLIRDQLSFVQDDHFAMLHSVTLKDPTTMLLFSIFLGEFGVDRFMLGDAGLGVGKLLTFGGCLVWWFIDLFLIQERTREVNFNNLMALITQLTPMGYARQQ